MTGLAHQPARIWKDLEGAGATALTEMDRNGVSTLERRQLTWDLWMTYDHEFHE
jgi:hypothetical protein